MRRSPSSYIHASALTVALFSFQSCSTATSRWEETLKDKGLCDGSGAKRKVAYEIEYALAPPAGLTIDQAKKHAEGAEVLRRFIRDQFFLILADYQVAPDDGTIPGTSKYGLIRREVSYSTQASIRDYLDLSREEEYELPDTEAHVRGIGDGGPLKLTVCTVESCRKVGLDEGDQVISVRIGSAGQIGQVVSFIRQTGIDLGRFLSENYFLVPKIQKASLCRQAGLPDTCLEKPFGGQLCSGSSLHYDLARRTPTTVAIQRERPIFCGVIGANYQLGEPWSGAHGPLEGQRESESWTAFHLLFALGLKTSTKSDSGVTKDLVTWNPDPLCRYARSRSELRTQ